MRTLVLLAALVAAGCTHHRPLDASALSAAEVNVRGARQAALVTLATGETHAVHSLHVAPDLTTWLDAETGALRTVSTGDVARVRFRSRGRGALEGAGIGLGLAAVAAGVTLVTYEGNEYFPPAAGAALAGFAVGVPASIVGGLTGAGVGSRTVFTPPASDE